MSLWRDLYEPLKDHYVGNIVRPPVELDKYDARVHRPKRRVREQRRQDVVAEFGYIDDMFSVRNYRAELMLEEKAALL